METTTTTHDDDRVSQGWNRRVVAQRVLVVAVWVGVLVAWRWYQVSNDLAPLEAAQRFIDAVDMTWWAIAAYVGVYLVRPIVLFPASVLTVVGGVLFGPIGGVIVVMLAANASAMIAYFIGRSLTRQAPDDAADRFKTTLVGGWLDRLRENSFESVLIMRLLFLPYDLVNYASGLLRVQPVAFLTATAIGSLPGTVSFVLIGASLERVDDGFGGIDTIALVIGIVIFVASLIAARLLRRRTPEAVEADPADVEFA